MFNYIYLWPFLHAIQRYVYLYIVYKDIVGLLF
jgi:hypothetical protein